MPVPGWYLKKDVIPAVLGWYENSKKKDWIPVQADMFKSRYPPNTGNNHGRRT
jgi:hypothetical protein